MSTVRLPPGPALPRAVQGAFAVAAPLRGVRILRNRHGDAFTVNVPIFGRAVVISSPAEIKQLFTARAEDVGNLERNLGRVLGPGSLFALSGEEHRKQRRLLVPPFHGRRLAAYERIVEEETVRELADWPRGRAFPTLPSMMRITLNVILRAVFGAEGAQLHRLRALLPPFVRLGSWLAVAPVPALGGGRWTPWGRFRQLRRDYDTIVDQLIAKAEREDLDARDDILALLLQARHDDGTQLSRADIADHLLTLLTAGHETTATTLAWAVERLRRHPAVLDRLIEEVDTGGSEFRQATITEVQRTRPVIDLVGRQILTDGYQLGRWRLPKGYSVLVSISLIHEDESLFSNASAFDPSRFLDTKPDLYQWIPFGGGTRRCLGAAFANMEMHVVLRTMLWHFTLAPTGERGERWHSRGVAGAPGNGGRVIVHRRTPADAPHRATAPGARA